MASWQTDEVWHTANRNFWKAEAYQKPLFIAFGIAAILALATGLAPEQDGVHSKIVGDWSFADIALGAAAGLGIASLLVTIYKFSQMTTCESAADRKVDMRDVAGVLWPWAPNRQEK